MTAYSSKCHDLATRWDQQAGSCVPCRFTPGREVTPNCGYDDEGGRHDAPSRPCADDFYNDGSAASCSRCTSCPEGAAVQERCSATRDVLCQDQPRTTTAFPTREVTTTTWNSTTRRETPTPPTTSTSASTVQWAVSVITISTMLVALCACIIYMKKKRGGLCNNLARKTSHTDGELFSVSTSPGTHPEDSLNPDIVAAPLQSVLDNMDVLEELVILLDPESCGIRNTKHLASHCGFSSSWVTYVYSMRDSKSPLKAVLEGVTSRHPDWTVGKLVELFRLMERNDAVVALAKLQPNGVDHSDLNCS